jgi:hypothetical protein
MVNAIPMEIIYALDARQVLELGNRTDTDNLFIMRSERPLDYLAEIVTHPKRKRRSPISVPRNIPVLSITDPICKPFFLDKCWYPNR